MSSAYPVYFGCKPCGLLFTTLDLGIKHLQTSPVHAALDLGCVEQYGADYRDRAALLLTSFVESSPEAHIKAINDAIATAHIRAARAARDAPSTIKRRIDRGVPGGGARFAESPLRGKRVRREESVNVRAAIIRLPLPFCFSRYHG